MSEDLKLSPIKRYLLILLSLCLMLTNLKEQNKIPFMKTRTSFFGYTTNQNFIAKHLRLVACRKDESFERPK